MATLFLVVFVDLLGFGILIPVIPLYALSFGANEFVGSLLIAVYSLFQFVFAPVLGRLSDERGRRPVILVSLFGSTLAWTLFGLAGELGSLVGAANGLVVLFLARALAGAMGGNIATAQAYIADITPPEDRARGLGLLGAAFGLGFVFGPAIGGLAASGPALDVVGGVVPWIPITEFTLPSLVAAALTAGNLAVAAVVLPEPNRTRSAGSEESRVAALVGALRTPALGTLVVSFFVASFAFSAFESQFIFLTNDLLTFGTAENALLLTYFGVVVAVVQGGLVGPLTDRFGEYRLAVVGAGVQVLTLGLVPFAAAWGRRFELVAVAGLEPWQTGASLALALVATPLAFGNALTNVSLNALVSRSASDETQGGAFGLTQSAGSLARTVGPALAGALYAGIAFWVPFVVAGLLFVPVLVLLRRLDGDVLGGGGGESVRDGTTDAGEGPTTGGR
ncbi:MFS transporter [Halomarina oriensis]|uniref:MFS transporter n=1 Tax=Halomarina oriensis TaxID=671145 RepID=UPI001303ED1C|nr:MFS transporter [Halomarina oriensis]